MKNQTTNHVVKYVTEQIMSPQIVILKIARLDQVHQVLVAETETEVIKTRTGDKAQVPNQEIRSQQEHAL